MMASAGKNEQEQLLHAVDEAWNQGIMVVTAAGNNGPKENSVTIPGISRKVLTVGSWDDNVTETGNSGRLTKNYSGFGPTAVSYTHLGERCEGDRGNREGDSPFFCGGLYADPTDVLCAESQWKKTL